MAQETHEVPDPSVAPAPSVVPVLVDLDGDAGPAVRRWLEQTPTLEPIDRETAGLVRASALVTVGGRVPDPDDPPAVLFVPDGLDAVQAATAASRVDAAAVLAWPGDRNRLDEVVRKLSQRATAGARATTLRVGGASGGVGTTTVAAALAGLLAWRGRSTLLVTHPGQVVPADRVIPSTDLAGAGVWSSATPVPGLPGLRAIHVDGASHRTEVDGGDALVVHDVGVDPEVDVLVARRDRAGVAAIASTVAAAVVLVDAGVAPRASVTRAAGRRPVLPVVWSTRVARAAWQGRLPASLPGAWLRALEPLAVRVA